MRFHHVVLVAAVVVAATAGTPSAALARGPAIALKDEQFGRILATPGHKALYYWSREKKDFRVRCTGACAKAWPPLVVRSAKAVPRHLDGIMGTFGTVTRPDGRIQVTFNRLPVYTYAHEGPDQVLCDDVDGWFVVRL
jgi:predicted lipoprotein with Yx(FWY)xxD motif